MWTLRQIVQCPESWLISQKGNFAVRTAEFIQVLRFLSYLFMGMLIIHCTSRNLQNYLALSLIGMQVAQKWQNSPNWLERYFLLDIMPQNWTQISSNVVGWDSCAFTNREFTEWCVLHFFLFYVFLSFFYFKIWEFDSVARISEISVRKPRAAQLGTRNI